MHEICQAAYPEGYYDPAASESWIRRTSRIPDSLLLRGEASWLGVTLARPWWNPMELEARFLPIVSTKGSGFELVKMNRMAIDWARERGAKRFYWVAVTGVDLGPLARRFGAVPVSPSYVLEL